MLQLAGHDAGITVSIVVQTYMEDLLPLIWEYNKMLPPHLVDMKYTFMRENLFRFFRGTNHLFVKDWSTVADGVPAPLTWVSGDLHLENFGSFKGENRLVYFDLNDFDEAAMAPATWEVARTVASIFVAFDALKINEDKALRMAQQFLKNYSCTLANGKPHYIERATAQGIIGDFLHAVADRKYKHLLQRRTKKIGDDARFRYKHERHLKLDSSLKKQLLQAIQGWIENSGESPNNFEPLDVVFRLAGTGSIGLERYFFLLRSSRNKEKFLLLDMKQVRRSCLLPYVTCQQPPIGNDAELIINVQRRMQNVPPALLGHLEFNGNLFLLQEMQPTQDNFNFKLIRKRYRDIYQVIDTMGMLTASSQLRSSGWDGSATTDNLIAFGKDQSWHPFIIEYGKAYLDRLRPLYHLFCEQAIHKV